MATKNGQRLTAEEAQELALYDERSVARPAKYDGVVFDNASGGGAFYRYATAEEDQAAGAAAKAEQDAAAARDRLGAKIDAEVAKRSEPAVPPKPGE